jgi:hypothetical protein
MKCISSFNNKIFVWNNLKVISLGNNPNCFTHPELIQLKNDLIGIQDCE